MALYDPRHLVAGENPPSQLTTLLAASVLPSWTAARTYALPAIPSSLTAISAASAYNPTTHGSHWQRFINTFALELELAKEQLDDALLGRFLDYPNYTHRSLDVITSVMMPSTSTTVLGVSANDTGKYLPTGVDSAGNQLLDPYRSFGITLLPATQFFDFYYGISVTANFTATGGTTSYVLPQRVGQYADGSLQLEWVTLNANVSSAYTLAADRQTLSVTASAGTLVNVHFTTFDVYYVLLEDLPVLYLRSMPFEVCVATSGTAPTSNGTTANLASNLAVLTPQIHMVWNELDEIGLFLNKPRHLAETNAFYKNRLIDSVLYPSGPTLTGIRNALATELHGISHLQWGPGPYTYGQGASATAAILALGAGKVYADAILVNRLPLPYYAITTTTGGSGAQVLSFPALDAGQSYTQTIQLLSSGGPVVPGLAPLTYTTSIGASALAIYDQIVVVLPQTRFSAPTRPWYAGSLVLWKNGTLLHKGVDFTEDSPQSFTLLANTQPGDLIQLNYIYDAQDSPTQILQPDFVTDITPILRVSVSYQANDGAAGTSAFPGYVDRPPGISRDALATNTTWTVTITMTNVGLTLASPATVTVTLPPLISFDGTYIKTTPLAAAVDLRYIDGDVIWVHNLTDAALQTMLYDSIGRATPLLRSFATQIATSSPLEWGAIRWDRSIWRSIDERYQRFGYLPNLLDPTFQSLTPHQLQYAGALTSTGGLSGGTTSGQATVGSSVAASPDSPYSINIATAGNAVGLGTVPRYLDCVSGTGSGDDLKLTVLQASDVVAAINRIVPLQQPLFGSVATPNFVPEPWALDAWWTGVQPGTFYLNQEAHTLFSHPIYVETTAQQTFLAGARAQDPLTVAVYDPVVGLVPSQRVYFHDAYGNLSLTKTDVLTGSGITRALAYAQVESLSFVSASDSLVYSVSATGSVVTLNQASTAAITVTYQIPNSFVVIPSVNGCYVQLDHLPNTGARITYEGTSGVNLAGLPLHPYYNPKQAGFVYLSSSYYVPTDLRLHIDPAHLVADGISTFTTKVFVRDAYGAGAAGLLVTILVNYQSGTVTQQAITDAFGQAIIRFPSSTIPQVAEVLAVMQLFDGTGTPLSSLVDTSFVELYSPYS